MSAPSGTSSATGTRPGSPEGRGSWWRKAAAIAQAGLTVGELLAGPISAEDAQAFTERSHDRAARSAAGLSLLTAACAFAWWPFDPWIYLPAGVGLLPPALWRSVLIVVPLAVAVLLLRARAGVGVFAVGLAVCAGALGYTAGMMGGVGTPWFHILNVAYFIPVVLPVPLRQRVGLTLLVGAGLWGGLLAWSVAELGSGLVPMAVAVHLNMLLLSIVFGNGLYLLNRQAFLQSRIIARDAEKLTAYSATLERRVAERTSELRDLLATVEAARETERARLSHELHDELGQELTVLGYEAAVLQKRYSADPAGIADQIEDLTVQLERARASLRAVVTDLRPRVLDDLGLAAAVEWLAARASERSGIPVDVEVEGDASLLPGDVAMAGFRIVQEALTNALRHAEPAHIVIRMAVADTLDLRVEDDGNGLPESPRAGVGLVGMRERALRLGGELRIGAGMPSGTVVEAKIPVRGLAGAESAE